jgi:hypothetical protein
MQQQVIQIHAGTPEKPAFGQSCNGCGVCCLAEPCPLGQVLSRRRTGTCDALEWNERQRRYFCGMAADPRRHLDWLPLRIVPLVKRLVLRWIASSKGCDCDLEVVP